MSLSESKFTIISVSWERVFLSLDLETDYTGNVKFLLARNMNLAKVKPENIVYPQPKSKEETDGKVIYHFCFNIAAVKGREFLGNGMWKILVQNPDNEEEYVPCLVSHSVAYQYDSLSRVFPYGRHMYAYILSFDTASLEDKDLVFVINSRFMKEYNGWRKRHYVEEARTFRGKINRSYKVVVIAGLRALYQIVEHLSPKKGKKVLLMSETHDYLWGNLKAIDEGIKERGLDQKYKISYSFRTAAGSEQSAFSWLKLVWKIAKQDYVFVDDYVPIFGFLDLNKRTKLIQVWHAGEGFKAVGYCRFGKTGSPFPSESCHKKYDYVLTGSQQLIKVFAEVFGIEEEAFLPVGMPRLDGFLDENRISSFKKEFYEKYPNLQNKKIVLFAPTYRGTGQKDAYYANEWLDLKQIYDYCGEDKIFLIKMHPFVTKPTSIPEEYKDRIIDFSDYPSINDLYYITDLLITDYSSNYFEYSLLKRPCLFYTPDRELYEISRGVHRSVKDSAPGKVCDTFEEMMTALYKEDFETEKIVQFVKDNFGEYDGKATGRVIDAILK